MTSGWLCRSAARFTAALAFVVVALAGAEASATTPSPNSGQKKICINGDLTGLVDGELGDQMNTSTVRLRGVRLMITNPTRGTVFGWGFADRDDGCVLVPVQSGDSGSYTIYYRTYAQLDTSVSLWVGQQDGTYPTYSFTVSLSAGQGGASHAVTGPSKALTRAFGTYSFVIQKRLPMTSHVIYVWKDDAPPWSCADPLTGAYSCDAFGTVQTHIVLASDADRRKYVMVHEYGHALLINDAPSGGDTDCSCNPNSTPECEGGVGMPKDHRLRGEEFSSCAAVEGWGHFVAADAFSNHGNDEAPMQYLDDGIVDLSTGTGGCPANADLPVFENSATDYSSFAANRFYIDCYGPAGANVGMNEPAYAVELDYARAWWRYHDSANEPGSTRTHQQLIDDIEGMGGWTSTNFYTKLRNTLSSSAATRWSSGAQTAGICSSSSC